MRASAALLPAALLALVACGGASVGGRDAYVERNEELLASLPRYPGAQEVERESSPYARGDSAYAAAGGYTTRAVYLLPRRVAQRDVIDFYAGELGGWTRRVEYAPGVDVMSGEERPGAWSATFTRGRAAVSVNTDNLIAGRRYEVVVDHEGARAGG